MKKILSIFMASVLFLSSTASISATTEKEHDDSPIVTAILINNETKTKEELSIKKAANKTRASDGSFSESYEAFAPIPLGSKTRDSQGGSLEESGVLATIKLKYFGTGSGLNKKIQVDSVSGAWYPNSSLYLLRDKKYHLDINSWASYTINNSVRDNSFNYTTGWGYVTWTKSAGPLGVHSGSDVTITVAGMESAGSYTLQLRYDL